MASKDFEDFSDDFDSLIEAEGPDASEVMEVEEPEQEPEPEIKKKPVPVPVPVKKPVVPVPVRRVAPIQQPVEEEEVEEPLPQQQRQQQPLKRPQQSKQQPPRYTAYKTEKRYGIIDNTIGQPIMESADIETLILTVLSDVLNKLDKVESSL